MSRRLWLSGVLSFTILCGLLSIAVPGFARTESEIRSLRILSYNVENLFQNTFRGEWEKPGRMRRDHSRRGDEPKSPAHVQAIRNIILESDADLLVITEVESAQALENLASAQLAGKYRALLRPGNDPRGINIGFLIKSDLPWKTRIVSHKEMRWTDDRTGHEGPMFSRDLPVLEVRRRDSDREPLFAVFGNHAKSKRDTDGDPQSRRWRSAQYVAATRIVQSYLDRGVNLMFAGDFNADIRRDPEVKPLLGVLKSSLAVAPDAVPADQRVTHTFHQNGGTTYSQLDDVMVCPNLVSSLKSARILRYKDTQGREMPLPRSFDQRSRQPSDHFPVLTEIATGVLFRY